MGLWAKIKLGAGAVSAALVAVGYAIINRLREQRDVARAERDRVLDTHSRTKDVMEAARQADEEAAEHAKELENERRSGDRSGGLSNDRLRK